MNGIDLAQDIRPLSEFRADAANLIDRARRTKRALVLTQRGHSSAVVIGVENYQELLDELELLRDVRAATAQIERGEGIPQAAARRAALAKLPR